MRLETCHSASDGDERSKLSPSFDRDPSMGGRVAREFWHSVFQILEAISQVPERRRASRLKTTAHERGGNVIFTGNVAFRFFWNG